MSTAIEIRPGDKIGPPSRFSELVSTRYDVVITSLTPLVHSSGTVGNDSILMTERVVDPALPDVDPEDVPCITGNSLRHALRESLCHTTLKILDLELRSLPLAAQHFLLSGGSLGKQAKTLKIDEFRKAVELFPFLGLFGGGLGSVLIEGRLQVGYALLICAQNVWRISDLCPQLEAEIATSRPAEEYRERRQGTRHDARRSTLSDRLLDAGDREKWEKDVAGGKVEDSTQMIYAYEAIAAGARWFWQVGGRLMTPLEHSALVCAIVGLASRGEIGAKNGTGHGRVSLRAIGERGEKTPVTDALHAIRSTDHAIEVAETVAGGYVRHVVDESEGIRDWLLGLR